MIIILLDQIETTPYMVRQVLEIIYEETQWPICRYLLAMAFKEILSCEIKISAAQKVGDQASADQANSELYDIVKKIADWCTPIIKATPARDNMGLRTLFAVDDTMYFRYSLR